MITMQQWMELIEYRITDGSTYCWNCFGTSAHQLDSWNGEHDGHSMSVLFDRKHQTVYSVEVHDYAKERSYRKINPLYIDAYRAELARRGTSDEAYDGVAFIDLETDSDFIEKATAIVNGLPYDTNIEIELDLPESMVFELMTMAHQQNITFNQLVNNILRETITTDKEYQWL